MYVVKEMDRNLSLKNRENNLHKSFFFSGFEFPIDTTVGGHAKKCRCPAGLNLEATDDATLHYK